MDQAKQRIEEDDTGAYVGYTHGGEAPTFYFENGRLTQTHPNPNNVGWHPNRGDRHFIKNIRTDSRSAENRRRVLRRMSLIAFSADCPFAIGSTPFWLQGVS
jgi:hypothetical protein